MKFEIKTLKVEDMRELIGKRGGRSALSEISPEQEVLLQNAKYAYSIWIEGLLVCCAGVNEYWKNRGEAWAVLDPKCTEHFVTIHRVVKRYLEICPVKRIEAAVEFGHIAGHRWVRLLGFQREAKRLKAYLPNGRDVSLYAIVGGF